MLRLSFFIPLIAYLSIGSNAVTIGPVTDLHIVNAQLSPDGYKRNTVVAGGTFPGPTIQGRKGDKFQINVFDDLKDTSMLTPTSIHWHGINQHKSNAYDGAAFVTQCPILPGNSFQYDFQVPDQAGTFWYHSHLGAQYCDGLRGPFIVYDPQDPYAHLYDVDDESTVITLADWYHYVSTEPPRLPAPNSTLINGLGRYTGGPNSPLAVVNVQQNKRYRFRIIGLSCDTSFVFSIDQHRMTVIEADGSNVDPLTVDSITVYAGQRYSVIVNANQKVDNYWMRALPDLNDPSFTNGKNSAIMRYKGARSVDPTTPLVNSTLPLVESNLHARENPQAPGKPFPGGADINLNMAAVLVGLALSLTPDFNAGTFSINGATPYESPDVPVLLQILSGAKAAQELLPKGSIFPIQAGKSVEIVLPGVANAGPDHPIHLHGHSFSVVRSAGNSTYNFENPVRRDVVMIGSDPTDLVTIRFETDNPGPWFIHCHIDWHLGAGFAAILAEDVEDVPAIEPTSESWKNLCPIYEKSLPSSTLLYPT
ncbi:laccase [Stereum hirsutum FP-91666 SS1]|uniref:laccase n=1 Tax=Stereum hirsutum (strain FP-91666) TaxID=721885 RepID=UPI000440F888|nr:laccase [Stereum hirsutum FP-91666 SS1]EIM87621.1 laccase [Stereum hirsutum FP-91666 SS1]